MFNIGIIGAGIISGSHADAVERMPEVKLAAVADIVEDRARKIADRLGASVYTDYKKMIENEKLDGVIINLPHGLHRESTVFCAEHGVSVLVEKPMANTVEDCRAMIDAAAKHGIKLMIGHIQHYFNENKEIKRIIASGELGRLVTIIETRNSPYFTESRPAWFLKKDMAGGGIFMNLGAHCIDKLLWVTGAKIEKITGKAGYYQESCEVEGNAQALIVFDSGASAVITCTGYRVPVQVETTFQFTEGAVKICGEGFLVSRKGSAYERVELPPNKDAFLQQLTDFVGSVLNGTEPSIPGEYGIQVIQAVQEAYKG